MSSPTLIDLSSRAVFRLSGPDRERYLNGQVSNQVSRATPAAAIEACVCNLKGKLDGVIHLTASDDGQAYLIDAPLELRESLLARLGRYLVADDCELEDVTGRQALVHALDPALALPGASWRESRRFGPAGRDGWLEPGHPALAGAQPPAVAEEIRICHGVPAWGAELSPDVLPAEAGLDRRAVDFHKGCYLGQEVISRIQSVGRVNRTLCLLALAGEGAQGLAGAAALAPGDALFVPGEGSKQAGVVTSVAPGGRLALAFLRREFAAPETRLVRRVAGAKVDEVSLVTRLFETG